MSVKRVAYIEEVSPYGDLPYLEFLLDQGHDMRSLESELYRKYREEGRLEEAEIAVNKLQKGVDYARRVFPDVKPYIDKKLTEMGYVVDSDVRIEYPKILPLMLPSRTVKGEMESDGKKEEFNGFSGAAAGVTCYKCKTPQGYLMFANLPLAYLQQEDVNPMGLHECIHIYLGNLGIPDEKQKRLEPYIDTWIVDILKNMGNHEQAEKYRKQSGYLNEQYGKRFLERRFD